MIDKVREWERQNGRPFFPPMIPDPKYRRALSEWKHLYLIAGDPESANDDGEVEMVTRLGAPPPPDKPINWVDEVVAWARTARGGNILSLPFLELEAESNACSSKYGLCE
jgi:hypothetical protein